jgi:hypothetical protein
MNVLRTPENKKIVINTKTDEKLYDAPVNPPNTGTRYTAGTDLYRHVARSGNVYYYTHSWSMWQGTPSEYKLVTEEEAKQFLLHIAGISNEWVYLSNTEEKRAKELFPDIFDEDA